MGGITIERQESELLPADPGQEVPGAQLFAPCRRAPPQQAVTRRVADGIVVVLEDVQVEDRERELLAVRHRPLEAGVPCPSVQQAGKGSVSALAVSRPSMSARSITPAASWASRPTILTRAPESGTLVLPADDEHPDDRLAGEQRLIEDRGRPPCGLPQLPTADPLLDLLDDEDRSARGEGIPEGRGPARPVSIGSASIPTIAVERIASSFPTGS